jgi:hypothetical protein
MPHAAPVIDGWMSGMYMVVSLFNPPSLDTCPVQVKETRKSD